jgi:hypothetical protein
VLVLEELPFFPLSLIEKPISDGVKEFSLFVILDPLDLFFHVVPDLIRRSFPPGYIIKDVSVFPKAHK